MVPTIPTEPESRQSLSSSYSSILSVKAESGTIKEGDFVVIENPVFTDHEFKQAETQCWTENEDEDESQEAMMS
jgi:hypothetical protein